MKKFTKVFMGLSLPITPIAASLPLVSCGQGEMLKITIIKGDNVISYKLYGDLFEGKDFKIKFDFDDGWEKIDETKTKVKCGDKLLVLNQDYTIEDDDTIAVRGSSVKNVNITVNAEAAKTLNKYTLSAEWKNIGPIMFLYPGDKILTDDLDVWGYKGDDEEKDPEHWEDIKYGPEEGKYLVAHDGIMLSKFGDEGYTFKYDHPESELPTTEEFNILIDYGKGYVIEDLIAVCSVEVTDFKIRSNGAPLELKVGGEDKWVEIETNAGASKIATWSIVAEAGEDPDVISIGRFDGKITPKKVGTCRVKATCVEKPELVSYRQVNVLE